MTRKYSISCYVESTLDLKRSNFRGVCSLVRKFLATFDRFASCVSEPNLNKTEDQTSKATIPVYYDRNFS